MSRLYFAILMQFLATSQLPVDNVKILFAVAIQCAIIFESIYKSLFQNFVFTHGSFMNVFFVLSYNTS